MNIYTCEQMSNGHPDKLADQISDAVVTDCLAHDKESRVAIEVLIKDNHIIIAGELTSKHKPNYRALVDGIIEQIGREKTGFVFDPIYAAPYDIGIMVEEQSPDFIHAYVRENYDLTPRGIIKRLGLLDVDYNKVSAYGHFTNPDMPWEQ